MKVKGKNIYNSEQALEFAKSVRGQYILSQALTISSNILESYEIEFDEYNKDKGVHLKRKLQVIRDKRIQELLNRPIGCDKCKKEEKYKDLIKVNTLF